MVDQRTQDLLDRANEVADDALVEIQRLMAEREQISARIKELEGLVRRFGRALPNRPKQQPSPRSGKSKPASGRVLARLGEHILERWPEGEFTPIELADAVGLKSRSSIYVHVGQLRDAGFIRKATRRRLNGNTQPTQFYAVMDADVLKRLQEPNIVRQAKTTTTKEDHSNNGAS